MRKGRNIGGKDRGGRDEAQGPLKMGRKLWTCAHAHT